MPRSAFDHFVACEGSPAAKRVIGSVGWEFGPAGATQNGMRARSCGEVWTMPYVTCPTCGERGKIPSSLIGARIKCRKCGLSFQVSPPSPKAAGGATAAPAAVGSAPGATAAASAGPTAAVELHGIEVEGLDASSWA